MTHPNFATNGASLEDCHTNFFALADLCGIKWRCLTSESLCVEPLEDPVLNSYCKCLAADLLCVWRRVRTTLEPNNRQQYNENQLNFNKELWIFWYGEEPDLTDLVSLELTDIDQGSWETGLSYECRTLLFKALHNLIERCLLSRGFARLGRWFFQPTECVPEVSEQSKSNNKPHDGTQLTFAFNFFVHGESTVCASVDVRQHPLVYRISKADLQLAQGLQNGVKVILGPYGLAGVITGQSYKDSDPSVQRVLSEWRQIYPVTLLTSSSNKDSSHHINTQTSSLPQHFTTDISTSDYSNCSTTFGDVVEVIVGGFRMKYPLCYVFKTGLDESHNLAQKSKNLAANKTNSKSGTNSSNLEITENVCVTNSKPLLSPYHQQIPSNTFLFKNNVSQEINISAQPTYLSVKNNENIDDVNTNIALWNVTDPCSCKPNCTCFRCKAKKGTNASKFGNSSSSLNANSTSIGNSSKKGDKSDNKLKSVKNSAPFHRRSPVFDSSFDLNSALNSCAESSSAQNSNNAIVATNPSVSSSISQPTSVPTYSYKSPISGGGLPSLQSTATTPTGGNGVDSPHSLSQSLNMDNPSSSVGEQTNLSLSPHVIKEESNVSCIDAQFASNATNPSPMQANNKERTHLEQLLSPNHSLSSLKESGMGTNMNEDSPGLVANQWTPGGQCSDVDSSQNQTSLVSVSATVSSMMGNSSLPVVNSNQSCQVNGVKRPFLAISTYDDNDSDPIHNGLLYDYSHLNDITNMWDIPQPKNRRIKCHNLNESLRRYSVNELYFNRKKSSINGTQLVNGNEVNDTHLLTKTKDPYEFNEFDETPYYNHVAVKEENVHEANVNHDCNATSPDIAMTVHNSQTIKDTPKSNLNTSEISATSPQTAKVFTRENELVASYSDLDQIFDTSSGEDSNDAEIFQAPLTPSGNSNRNTGNNAVIVGGTVLDDHPKSIKNSSTSSANILGVAELTRMFPTPPSLEPMAPSPCNNFIGPDSTIIDDNINPCSPITVENSKDWFVYKPAVQSMIITSSKYAPLSNIPHQQTLPMDCIYKQSLPNQITHNIQQQIQTTGKSQLNQLKSKTISTFYNHVTPQRQNAGNYMPPQQQMTRLMCAVQNSASSYQYSPLGGGNRLRPNLSPVHMSQPTQQMANAMHTHAHQSQQSLYMTMDGQHIGHQSLPHYHPNHANNYPGESNVNAAHVNYYQPYMAHRSPHPHMSPANAIPPQIQYSIQSQQNAYLNRSNLHDASAVSLYPEAHSLIVNLVLSDSMLNLFKDHNFESCSICVCNMNIKGNDVGVYLPDSLVPGGYDESQYRCTCGFSAVTNRHNSHFAGLFYEDELEVTGVLYDPCDGLKKKSLAAIELNVNNSEINKEVREIVNECDHVTPMIVDLLAMQCNNMFSSSSVLSKAVHYDIINSRQNNIVSESGTHISIKTFRNPMALSYRDGCEVTFGALLTAKLYVDNIANNHRMMQNHTDDHLINKNMLHEWSFKVTNFPSNNQEVMHVLKQLQPLMQESVQRKKTKMWDVTYTVSGPLTWRQFHRLAGRGTEDQCEPQPIPSLLVGYDKDLVALSPFALKFWEKLSLEPYSVSRDIAYIVVSPENDYILSHVRTFFKELSTTYEMLRLGKHCPIAKVLRDGIMRVGKLTLKKLADEPVDEWFNQIGDGNVATKLKMYAQACRYHLAPQLSNQTLDKSLFDSNQIKQSNDSTNINCNNIGTSVNSALNNTVNKQSNASPAPLNDINQTEKLNDENQSEYSSPNQSQPQQQPQQQQQQQNQQSESDQDEDPHKQPAIVIYIIEPFSYGSIDKDLYRLSSVGLLRCYSQILSSIPENLHNSIHLQLVSLDSILCNGKNMNDTTRQDQLKELAFSVFAQCRQLLIHQSTVKSLTGFGPAAAYDLFLKSKDPLYNISRVFTPPFILAPLKDKQTELGEMFGDRREKSQILYVCYCLTEDQRWLVASCTNDKGDILETTCINIEIPNRTRRRKACVKKFGLEKLMRFIQTVMSDSVQPWRLVIGRLGRIGHGELKEWTFLLSKKSLLRYSRQLREMCRQCSHLTPFDQPSIFSACLISLEADTALRVFPDHYTPDERFSSNTCSLSTPEDASCTHILVFPTSATTQSSHASFSIDPLGANLGEDDLLQALDDPDLRVEDDINDIFQWTESPPQSPGLGSPRRDGLSQPDSPGNRQTGYGGSGSLKVSNVLGGDIQDEPTQLLQQPLALGFYVSTARTGPLPRWFWSSCPHMENSCPVFLKSALLIHTPLVQQNSDDILHSNIRNYHSLDSNLTTDVLRCVLEGYNALSWLSLDASTHDRMSCLPVHIQILMQLYHTVQAMI